MKSAFRVLAVFIVLVFTAALSYLLVANAVLSNQLEQATTNTVQTVEQGEVAEKIAEAEQYLDTFFVEEPDKTVLGDAAVSAMIEATGDRWSYYVSAAEYEAYMETVNNAYVGIGVTISWSEEGLGYEIMSVTAGGPADAAGIQVGDILTEVEGQNVGDLGLDGTKNTVRGQEGTSVHLTLRRDGQVYDVDVMRASIETIVVSYEMLEDNIGLITIENFDANSAHYAKLAVESLVGDGAESLIFDVRNNPGGLKTELISLLDYLLPEGPLFYSYHYNGASNVDYSDASCVKIPMVVLVNENSYSAAEFFAAALWEYDYAKVVGTQTSGKGYFQNTFQLTDGSALVISTGKYCTPNGVSLAGIGITPDEVVELSDEEFLLLYYDQLEREEDDQLQAAIALLSGG